MATWQTPNFSRASRIVLPAQFSSKEVTEPGWISVHKGFSDSLENLVVKFLNIGEEEFHNRDRANNHRQTQRTGCPDPVRFSVVEEFQEDLSERWLTTQPTTHRPVVLVRRHRVADV